MADFNKLDDSGERISYGEGMAMREPSTGKGRYDLVSPFAMRRLAKHYEQGALKYTKAITMTGDELLSVVEKELERITSAQSVVHISCIAKGCAEVVTKNHCVKEILNMLSDREKMQENGEKSIQSGLRTQQGDEEKTRHSESEINAPSGEPIYGNSESTKKHITIYQNGKITNVQSVEDLYPMLEQYILTIVIQQDLQEDYYVVGATTAWECLKSLLTLCKKLYPIFGIQLLQEFSDKYIVEICGNRNWEKGIPFSRYVDSAKRHLDKYIMGMQDEDHLAAAAWNIFAIMHHQELGQTELDDMPHYECKYEHE